MLPAYVTATRAVLPVLPLRDMVVFPNMLAPCIVGRAASIQALEVALAQPEQRIFLATQRDPKTERPRLEDLFPMGVVAVVRQSLRLRNQHLKVQLEGVARGLLLQEVPPSAGTFLQAEVDVFQVDFPATLDLEARLRTAEERLLAYLRLAREGDLERVMAELDFSDVDRFVDRLALELRLPTTELYEFLELLSPAERLDRVLHALDIEIEKLELERKLESRVKRQMEKAQREFYLQEKLKAIQQELGRREERDSLNELRERIKKTELSPAAREKAEAELERLEAMPPISAEATVSRNYLEWLLSVPWKRASRENRNLDRARKILDQDHYGLEKIKERILEFLAVRQLSREPPVQILCFVGPPGVGKSSLAASIARATGRVFVRLSLGGVRDEAEIRGHRRTYIGSFPGQIIQQMKRAGTVNPVFLLDEVDKMTVDFRGDPSAALLEVLDPAQNKTFVDHYLDVEYDLSRVMFIATANFLEGIPLPLRDRLEILTLSGYTLQEKLAIASNYLVPKQVRASGLDRNPPRFTLEALEHMVTGYTREAGVRGLEREIAAICRKLARLRLEQGGLKARKLGGEEITRERVEKLLGRERFKPWKVEEAPEVGVATGLAWTATGGELLTVEVEVLPGKGELLLTGMLGEIMQESARAALSYLRSRAMDLGLDPGFHKETDLHIHVPEGAIPKDGPSAGITMAVALASALLRTPVRQDLAMTGEITLRGRVLPVGGIKDKVLAAQRAGLRRVVLPRGNEKDLEEVPAEVLSRMEILWAATADEVLDLALQGGLASASSSKAKWGRYQDPALGTGSSAH